MTERYTKNNWGKKNRVGKTPAEKAVEGKIVYNDGNSKLIINKSGDFYKENRNIVKTSVFNRNHPVSITILVLILITGLIQIFYQMVYYPFETSLISSGAKELAGNIIFFFPFVLFIVLTAYVVFVWIREKRSKKEFFSKYINYLVDNYMKKPECSVSDRSEAEAIIRKDMKNQVNICDNGLRSDGKHRMSKELRGLVDVMCTVAAGLIIFNIIIPFWISVICQYILSAMGKLG